jgi:hypothetical protein
MKLCARCRQRPVRNPVDPQSRFCSGRCKTAYAKALRRDRRKATPRHEPLEHTGPLRDLTAAQIEAKLAALDKAKRARNRCAA